MKVSYIDRETGTIADLLAPDALLSRPEDPFHGWLITRIQVPSKHRGKGYGSAMLKRVLQDADAERVDLYLVVASSGALTDEQLEDWYGRYGFVPTGTGGMIRRCQM